MSGPSYKFRLEPVRALRERREEEAKMELAGAMMRRDRCLEEITATQARVGRACAAQLTAPCGELIQHQVYMEHLERVLQQLRENLMRHDQDVAARRATLTTRSQDRKALEKLKEKGLAAHNRELLRVEQLMLDEIAVNGYWRQAA